MDVDYGKISQIVLHAFLAGTIYQILHAIDFVSKFIIVAATLVFVKFSKAEKPLEGIIANFIGYSSYILVLLIAVAIIFISKAISEDKLCLYERKLKGNNARMLKYGFLLGAIFSVVAILPALFAGDIQFTFNSFNIVFFMFACELVIIKCLALEFVHRSIVFFTLKKWCVNWEVVVYSAIIYISLVCSTDVTMTGFEKHSAESLSLPFLYILNTGLISAFYIIIMEKFKSFWFCCAHHVAWTLIQSMLFGLQDGNLMCPYGPLVRNISETSTPLYNTVVGIEGTLITTAIYGLSIIISLYISKRKSKKSMFDR